MKSMIMKRRIAVVIMIISVLLLQMQPVLALTDAGSILNQEKRVLDEIGMTQFATIVDSKEVTIDGKIKTEFELEIGNIKNQVVVLEDNDEKKSLQVKQGNICNVLELYENGDIILDGNKVEIVYENNSAYEEEPASVMPRAGATIYWKDKVSYGTAADYSNYLKAENISSIALKQEIYKVALAALIEILGKAMSGITGEIVSFALDASEDIYQYFMDQDPYSKYMSCKSKVYTHKNYSSGYIPTLFTFIYKYKATFYSGQNYSGTSKQVQVFKYNMQG